MNNNKLEKGDQAITNLINDFIFYEDECRKVQYREKSDIIAESEELLFADHSGDIGNMCDGYRIWLKVAQFIINSAPQDDLSRVLANFEQAQEAFNQANAILKYMAKLSYDPKTLLKDESAQRLIKDNIELVSRTLEDENSVFIPYLPLDRQHIIAVKIFKQQDDYYITYFDTFFDIKKLLWAEFTEDGMPITDDRVIYQVNVENVPKVITYLIESNYARYHYSPKTLDQLKRNNILSQLGNKIDPQLDNSLKMSSQRVGNCSTRGVRSVLKDVLALNVSHSKELKVNLFRECFDIITNTGYDDALLYLNSFNQGLGKTKEKQKAPNSINVPKFSTNNEIERYLIQEINDAVNYMLKFPKNTEHLNLNENRLDMEKLFTNGLKGLDMEKLFNVAASRDDSEAYKILAQNIAKELVRRGIITKSDDDKPLYPLKHEDNITLLQSVDLVLPDCIPEDGNTPKRLDMIYQKTASIVYSDFVGNHFSKPGTPTPPVDYEFVKEIKDLVQQSVETKYSRLLSEGKVVITRKMVSNIVPHVTKILKNSKNKIIKYNNSEKSPSLDSKYIRDNKEQFVKKLSGALSRPNYNLRIRASETLRQVIARYKSGIIPKVKKVKTDFKEIKEQMHNKLVKTSKIQKAVESISIEAFGPNLVKTWKEAHPSRFIRQHVRMIIDEKKKSKHADKHRTKDDSSQNGKNDEGLSR